MTEFRDTATQALRLLGVFQAGETPPAQDMNDCLTTANRMINRWAAENLLIYSLTRSTWTITSGTQTYSVGSGQTVNIARPVFVDHINFQDTSFSPSIEYQLQPLTDDAWSKTVQKTLTSTYPSAVWYNPTYPYGTITLWPVPTSATLQGVIYAQTALTAYASIDDDITLPPAYEELLVTHLAKAMAPEYQAVIHPTLQEMAVNAMTVVERANKRLMDMAFDTGALVQGQNRYGWWIYSGP